MMLRLATYRKELLRTGHNIIMSSSAHTFVMDDFAMRQFDDPNYTGTRIKFDPSEFEAKVNEFYTSGEATLKDGYAPFCKHLFIPNFCGVKCGYARITADNRSLLQTEYEARSEKELPVLVRFFKTEDVTAPDATHLDIILYSKEQIIKENEAMGNPGKIMSAPWGIISVKGQTKDYELPMQPITMLRNALGRDEGGSGVKLEREKYSESVNFWKEHASFK
ncbi:hypothetical protein SARC_01800 [Sphaeroforma arctica JP610]|uniref:Uncharacterized protein n=1 Tax=Sphaeroforma arctica JP610 TaxID=667725 RepID=A0A0L0GAW9_9EUKA|nr:hypothetical protein SARC_01800 [Sphaeroforma arctica JP610]KNC86041.1 hypothetical protein SARC_01800 [Sphaeroforma arctica JP610]|eukprot:XP_014159943.1 hypothetical protein SARC_01800 [Sphaeroforma arctica JP610]